MEVSRYKRIACGLLLTASFVVSLGYLAYPIYVIRPFRQQGVRELALALQVMQTRGGVELGCVAGAILAFLLYLRTHPVRARRNFATAAAVLVCAFAGLSRINIYELMFHPDSQPAFAAVQQVKIDPDDKVLAVKLSGSARAYPIRIIAYHHIINDTVGGEPIVTTY